MPPTAAPCTPSVSRPVSAARCDGQAVVILGVDKTAEAQQVLADNYVTTLGPEVYNV
jgi:hypothetical protein